ncbi:MAG: RNA methyltransferase [Gammaproteobacteria bacterium]|nr:RNA methyltransferase [Gammaproteobacteria bacterium]
MTNLLDHFKIVLVETSHPGNIGAAARAMKTMGFSSLALVNPKHFPDEVATARASGATDILATAQVVDSLQAAIADCQWVVGMSARVRSTEWQLSTPRVGAAKLAALEKLPKTALVFGRESSGLTNAELQSCQAHWCIDANPDYGSLNLAAAVQVICYELRVALNSALATPTSAKRSDRLVNNQEREQMLAHLIEAATAVGFLDPDSPKKLEERLRKLFNRADLTQAELQIIRGLSRRMLYTAQNNSQGTDSDV